MLKTVVLHNMFMEMVIHFIFHNSLMKIIPPPPRKTKHLFEIKIFCNINVFSVSFDQFNVSLLNKSLNLFKKKNLFGFDLTDE